MLCRWTVKGDQMLERFRFSLLGLTVCAYIYRYELNLYIINVYKNIYTLNEYCIFVNKDVFIQTNMLNLK